MNEKLVCEICKKEVYQIYILEELVRHNHIFCDECYVKLINGNLKIYSSNGGF